MIQLIRKQIFPETMEVLYDNELTPETLASDFEIKGGKWYINEEGWLVGENRENAPAMVISKEDYFGDILLEFDAATILPATRDIDLMIHGSWNEETNERDVAYVAGIQGWWQGMVGFEKSPTYDFLVQTKLFDFKPGQVYHICVGNIGNDLFIAIDGVVALEVHDPNPIDIMKYGKIGFEAYCTKIKFKNVKVKRVTYIDTAKPYDPEF